MLDKYVDPEFDMPEKFDPDVPKKGDFGRYFR